jgi:hypothetical protein
VAVHGRAWRAVASNEIGSISVQTLTEIVAAVVVHSSAAAYSHFGVTLEPHPVQRPVPVERTIARTVSIQKPSVKAAIHSPKSAECGPLERVEA